ncbi:DUF998 domain-containing protein [Nonomuraea diastatica]|uniref:DUF998 domain-containing protein n=1 Tax=Nonomuraea diastatica TaxID=1848329 RepID=A0A4R4WSC8_9ACTN|nr:DUF998 domain-containing protein [Nonomuraea diastatica]TDD20469.1 DUF998 domain-containing protein [Nonomuraea diastatica]
MHGEGNAQARATASWERGLLACGVIGPALFVTVFLVTSAVHPAGYDPLRHTVSAFVLGEFGWVQRTSFIASGGLLLAYAVGLRPALRRYSGGWWVPVLIGLFAVGMIGSGVFAADPVAAGVTTAHPYPLGTPVGPDRTLHGVLHDLFGTPVFLGLPVACCMVAYRLAAAGHKGWAAYSTGTALAFLTGFVLTAMALAQPPLIPSIGGLLQRLTIIIGWAWLAALAAYLIRRTAR